MKNALVITGGYINYQTIEIYAENFDLIIAADSGYVSAAKLNIEPDIIVGDFDSSALPHDKTKIITAPAEKDETDTMLACTVATERGANAITIIGGTGGRADHFLSNLFWLEALKDKNISVTLTDGENTLKIINDETVSVEKKNGYFSVFALDPCTVTISGCKYPLNNYILTRTNPFAVSNEVTGKKATVTVKGKAILCESTKYSDEK